MIMWLLSMKFVSEHSLKNGLESSLSYSSGLKDAGPKIIKSSFSLNYNMQ